MSFGSPLHPWPPAPLAEAPGSPAPSPAEAAPATTSTKTSPAFSPRRQWIVLLCLWAAIYVAALWTPPLLDDADATHAQAAAAMLHTGDLVTLHVDGIRYLEKPPLPYWVAAGSLRLFGENSFAVHLPLALTVLALAGLGWLWGRRAFDGGPPNRTLPGAPVTGFYTALFTLTAAGVFLFTRIFIPDALLSLLLALALYAALQALEAESTSRLPVVARPVPARWISARWATVLWLALAAAVLTKGLVALVLVPGALVAYLLLSGELPRWRRLHPVLGSGLLLAVAAPWHILAGLRNRGGAGGHGFFWFYFVNEHVLRFLGRRNPPDYNKLPAIAYWVLHLVWLFPWSILAPVALHLAWVHRGGWLGPKPRNFAERSCLLLVLFSGLLLVFFSLSTNQEYYTFPVYLPLLLLLAAALVKAEAVPFRRQDPGTRLLIGCHTALAVLCLVAAATLAAGLWSSRHLQAASQVGLLAAHRGVGDYTLSMSHFFDLTGASFSALRLPASLACGGLAIGSVLSLSLRLRGKHLASTVGLALMSTVLLVAAHLALVRFSSMLSSQGFALEIERLAQTHATQPGTEVLLYGDQALGSSIPFYLGRPVELVEGRSTSMLFGSSFPDAPHLFVTAAQLEASWGHGPRKLLFVPLEHRAEVDSLLGPRGIPLYESAGKLLITDRPLHSPSGPPAVDTAAPPRKQ